MKLDRIRKKDIVPPLGKRSTKPRIVIGGFVGLLLTSCLCLLFHSYLLFPFVIQDSDMSPALNKGDWVYVWRSFAGKIKRGKIVVIRHPRISEYKLIRRVIALPGETVDMYKKQIYINGRLLQNNWEKQAQKSYNPKANKETNYYNFTTPVQLKKDEVLVLADNRRQLLDSRTIGLFSLKQVLGIIY